MNSLLEEYKRYLNVTYSCKSKPVRYIDAFDSIGYPPNAVIHSKITESTAIFAGTPLASNISITGKGKIKLIFGRRSVVENIQINVADGDLTIFFAPYSEVKNVVVQSSDPDNYLHFGCRTTVNVANFLLQGKKQYIFIGHDCMFSTQVYARTSDSHSMYSYASGERINLDGSVIIGDHVWVGRDISFNKGVIVSDDVVIGQGSVISGNLHESHCCYAGVPAKKLRENITWDRTQVENIRNISETFSWRPQVPIINNFLLNDDLLSLQDKTANEELRQSLIFQKSYRWLEVQKST